MIADYADASARTLTCYICDGTCLTSVAQWNKRDEVFYTSATCPRCQGRGWIIQGPFTEDLITCSEPSSNFPRCICEYDIDGPMGNPRCPAR